MKLSATFIQFAWFAHESRCRWRDNDKLKDYFEGKRDAYLFAARMCRDEDRKRPSAGKKKP